MEYTVIRSRRRTLSLQITRELAVIVRAPMRFPQREIDRFVASRRDWIEENLKRQQLRNESYPPPSAEELATLRKQAKDILPGRVAFFSGIMGLVPSGVKITSAKTRFGSCSGKNSLCFSCLLMRYPMEAVDYVVVHELAHIIHKNHGKEFYALIASVLPDYKARMALLKHA